MPISNDDERRFYETVSYNITAYLRLKQISHKDLADTLGLTVDELQSRLCLITRFTAWELELCARKFNCGYHMLCPEIRILRADAIWQIARRLPESQFDQLFDMVVKLARETGIKPDNDGAS